MSAVAESTPSIEIFFSYAHEDEPLRQQLVKHLSMVWRRGVASWHDRKIGAGTEWEGQIDEHLHSAQIILLLISKDFLASRYCYDIEMARAMERHERGQARVIPILLKPVALGDRAPFRKLQCLPADGTPVTSFEDPDEAFALVAEQIMDIVDDLLGERESGKALALVRQLPKRGRVGWIVAAFVVAAVVIGLILFGIRARQPRVAQPPAAAARVPALTEKERINLAFAVGSSVAMAGQSTQTSGNRMFDRALTGLGLPANTVRRLHGGYEEIDRAVLAGAWTYDQFEDAKLQLMRQIAAPLRSDDATAVQFGHDVTALLLLVRFWSRYPREEEALRIAEERVERLRRSTREGIVPPAFAERIRALDDVDLIQTAYRRDAEQLLDDTVRTFDMKPQN